MKIYIEKKQIFRMGWQVPAILLLAVMLGLIFNTIRSTPLPMIGDWSTQGRMITEGGEQLTIPLEEAKHMFQKNLAIFIDARDAFQYEEGHIQGARNLPWHDVDEMFMEATQGLSRDTLLITYCDGEACNLSHDLTLFLTDLGFSNVKILVNGWTVWLENNLPTETGK